MAGRKPPRRERGHPRPEDGHDHDPEPKKIVFEPKIRARAILREILARTPPSDERYELLQLLDFQLQADEKQLEEARQALEKFEEVYEKLTSPANRIGTFLEVADAEKGIAYIAVGDAEYYANVDPNLDLKSLKRGTRVKVNEAFAVVGDLGYHPEGPIVKVSEVLPDGRLRVSFDGHGLQGRIILRSSDLENVPLKPGDEVRLEPSLRVALEHFQKSEVRGYYLEKIPEITWDKIGGQEEAIKVIKDAIERPLLYPELYKKFGKRQLKGILLYGPPGCGKCVSPETPVQLADGRVVPIERLFQEAERDGTRLHDDGEETILEPRGLEVLSLDPTRLTIVPKRVDFVYRQRYEGDLYEITTHSGRTLTVTPEHPFLVLDQGVRKVPARALRVGDYVAVPRRLPLERETPVPPAPGSETGFRRLPEGWVQWISPWHPHTRPVRAPAALDPELAEFFGLLLSEGSRPAGGVSFHNSDPQLVARVATVARDRFGVEPLERPDTSPGVTRLVLSSTSLVRWLKQAFDFELTTSRSTRVPEAILRSPNGVVAAFLRAVFEAEATVRRDVPEIELSTASREFANQLAYLLLRFGIVARLREKRVPGRDHLYYRLYLSGVETLRAFEAQIGFLHPRKRALLARWTAREPGPTNVDVVPNIQRLLARAREALGVSKTEFYRTNHNYEGTKALSRRKLRAILAQLPLPTAERSPNPALAALRALADSDVLWDRVVSIRRRPYRGYVYDLTVADTHTFIAGFGGIVTHNTLIAKATAYNLTKAYRERTGKDVRECFMFINGPQLLNMWLGETERMVREIFAAARERAKEGQLVFVFIDEADALLRVRSSGRYLNIANTVVPQFAAEMDGLVDLENVVVMLTSNRPDYIDPAILRPERIDRKVKVARPDRRASADIFRIYLNENGGVPLDPDWVEAHGGDEARAREALVQAATDYLFRRDEETAFLEVHLRSGRRETLYWPDLVSGALIKSAVERAKEYAIQRCIEAGRDDLGVSPDDLFEAIRQEYRENEIFPKTDYLEDWLKLIDYEPEDVMEVRPIREGGRRPPLAEPVV